jgi:hypothetical protein
MEPDIKPVAVPHSDLAQKIKEAHSAVIVGMKDTVMKSMALGDILTAAKDRMPHGEFIPWLEGHCGVAKRTAQQCMKWARNRPMIEEAMKAHDHALFTQADANAAIGSKTSTGDGPKVDPKVVVANVSDKLLSALNELKQSNDVLARLEAQRFVDRLAKAEFLDRPALKATG